MSDAPSTPLIDRATHAIIESERTKYPMQEFVSRRYARAALDACHAAEMREVIGLLVDAKDMKDRLGDTPAYRAKQEEGWARARAVLSKLLALPNANNGLGYCPICGAAGIVREKRPDGNDQCEVGHTYPSRDALLTKMAGQP